MTNEPKIVLFDVETSPVRVNVFSLGKAYLSHNQIAKGERFDIICLAWKYLGDKKTHTLDWGLKKQNSEPMIREFTRVIEGADLAIAHNLKGFDLKQINTSRLMHNLPPIAWPCVEDTLQHLRKHFFLASNRLDYVTKILFGAGKDKMSLEDWEKIKYEKDEASLDKMLKYNVKDVLLLEKLFKRIRPWMNLKKIKPLEPGECPSCFSKQSRSKGRRVIRNHYYQRRVCLACGHTFDGARIEEVE